VARASFARGFVRLFAAIVVLAGIGCFANEPVPLDVATRPTRDDAPGRIPDLYLNEVGRPAVLPYSRPNEPKRGVWFTPPPSVAVDPVTPLRALQRPRVVLVAGVVAQGLSGRGPPSPIDP